MKKEKENELFESSLKTELSKENDFRTFINYVPEEYLPLECFIQFSILYKKNKEFIVTKKEEIHFFQESEPIIIQVI